MINTLSHFSDYRSRQLVKQYFDTNFLPRRLHKEQVEPVRTGPDPSLVDHKRIMKGMLLDVCK